MDEIINKIYTTTINVVLDGFNENEYDSISKKYLVKLHEQFDKYDPTKINSDVFEKIIASEINKWRSMNRQTKRNIFIPDVYLTKIATISVTAYRYALKRLNEGLIIEPELADKMINEMNNLLNDVFEYNKQVAEWYISHGALDLTYAMGNSEVYSDRLSASK